MDIQPGDFLTVGGKDYPIRAVWDYSAAGMVSASFLRMASVTCSTKRPAAVSGGKSAGAAAHLTGLKCTPLDPVSAEIQQRVALNTPFDTLQTFLSDGSGFVQLVLEDLRR